jgi:hypothetical protein
MVESGYKRGYRRGYERGKLGLGVEEVVDVEERCGYLEGYGSGLIAMGEIKVWRFSFTGFPRHGRRKWELECQALHDALVGRVVLGGGTALDRQILRALGVGGKGIRGHGDE